VEEMIRKLIPFFSVSLMLLMVTPTSASIFDLLGEPEIWISLTDIQDSFTYVAPEGKVVIDAKYYLDSGGKLANIYADIPKYPIKNYGKFKVITGGDRFLVERKFKDPFFIKNHARLIFSANELPEVNDTTYAFWRRWVIVEFPNKFPPNPNLLDDLTIGKELSGLLNKVLYNLTRIEEVGVTKTDKVEKAMQEWMARSNNVYAFVREMPEIDPAAYEEKDKLYSAYTQFYSEKGYPPKAKNVFAQELPRFVPVRAERPRLHGKRVQVWRGIRLKEVKPEDVAIESEGFCYDVDLTKYEGGW